jgi:hypothetical protein
MRFICKTGCGFIHEPEGSMHWTRKDDEIISNHLKECPNK